MKSLPETILEHSQCLPEGSVLYPREFLHFGSRAAVDQAFSRLVRNGQLLRVSRGLYVAPVVSRFGKRAPATEAVVSALASKTHEVIVVSGAKAANSLGLTRQVPVREVFFTSGRARTLQLGKASVKIEHAPHWQLALGGSAAGEAVRALAWLGQSNACQAMEALHKKLPSHDWEELYAARSLLPDWMAAAIGRQALQANKGL